MIKHESGVNIVNVLQHLEEVDVLVETDALHNKRNSTRCITRHLSQAQNSSAVAMCRAHALPLTPDHVNSFTGCKFANGVPKAGVGKFWCGGHT